MRKIAKKILGFVLVVCLFMSNIPVTTVSAAAEASVVVSPSVSATTIYTDETVKVQLKVRGVPGTGEVVPTDIVLILDQSGSMSGTKIEALKTAAINFINKVNMEHHRVGVISYSTGIDTNVSFTTDKTALTDAVSAITATGNTYIGTAIDAANTMMTNEKRTEAKPVMVIVTDGQPSDESAARAAAKVAKDKGYIFYTVALFENVENAAKPGYAEYIANELLKDLATTAIHHHFVGETGLGQAYADIAGDVGVANPYNVKVVQQIADNFEYVTGSADSNIPKPTISGKTLTWEMVEIKDQIFELSYEIKPVSGCEAGRYPTTSLGYVEFEDFSDEMKTANITTPHVTVKIIPDLTNAVMTPNSATVGDSVTIKVQAEAEIPYRNDFKVTFGGQEVATTSRMGNYFKFQMPDGLAAGEYEVEVTNNGKTVNVGTFTLNEPAPAVPLDVLEMTPDTAEVGTVTTVKVTTESVIDYASDFKITFGDQEVKATSTMGRYFKFVTPEGLAEGEYDVIVTNDGIDNFVGTFTYTAESTEPPIVITGMTPSTIEEGTVATIKVTTESTIDYASDFKILFDGQEVKATSKMGRYFKFITPAGLAEGDYEVSIENDGYTIEVGTLTCEKPTPVQNFVITGMTPTTFEEGTTATIKVTTESTMNYASDFKITVDGVEVKPTSKMGTYFKFVTPEGLTEGDYEVTVTNDGYTASAGTLTCEKPTPVQNFVITGMTPTTFEEGTTATIKVTTESVIDYASDFKITVDGVEVKPTSKMGTYFKFVTPEGLTEGDYEVTVTNDGYTASAGILTCEKPAPVPNFVVTGMTPTTFEAGTVTTIKVTTADTLNYASDFKITFGGVEVEPSSKMTRYFKFVVPEGLAVGDYEVTVTNDGYTETIGTVKCENPAPEPPISIAGMTPTTVKSGVATTIKVTTNAVVTYKDDFCIKVGGTTLKATSKMGRYFKFVIPKDFQTGTYTVEVTNGGTTTTVGSITVQ